MLNSSYGLLRQGARLVTLLEPYAWVHGDGMVDSHNYVLS
jgi:hypothetical protein